MDPAADQFYQYSNLARKLNNGSLLSFGRCQSVLLVSKSDTFFMVYPITKYQ